MPDTIVPLSPAVEAVQETPAQALKRRQAELKHDANAELDALITRMAAIMQEARELSEIDLFAGRVREALSSFAQNTSGHVQALKSGVTPLPEQKAA